MGCGDVRMGCGDLCMGCGDVCMGCGGVWSVDIQVKIISSIIPNDICVLTMISELNRMIMLISK